MRHTLSDETVLAGTDLRNAYGLMHAKATYEGMLKKDNERLRPFILSRSGFMGTQKYAAIWTGDNRAYFNEMPISISMMMQLTISGIHFTGSDVPGFADTPTN